MSGNSKRQPAKRRRASHHLDRRNQQKRQKQHHLWPLRQTWLERLIKAFPRGSAWLERLDDDERERLHFFRWLHKFYQSPLIRLSSANKERARIIAEYIEELEDRIEGDEARQHHHVSQRRMEASGNSPERLDYPHKNNKTGRRHDKSSTTANLTRENLALLGSDSEQRGGELVRNNCSRERRGRVFYKAEKPPARRQPSKAYQQQTKETFLQQRQGQIDAEATHLRKRLQPVPQPVNQNPTSSQREHDYVEAPIRAAVPARLSEKDLPLSSSGDKIHYQWRPVRSGFVRTPGESAIGPSDSHRDGISRASRQATLGYGYFQ